MLATSPYFQCIEDIDINLVTVRTCGKVPGTRHKRNIGVVCLGAVVERENPSMKRKLGINYLDLQLASYNLSFILVKNTTKNKFTRLSSE